MKLLVAYATRHGATGGIAERIAATLRDAGIEAEARPVGEVRDAAAYDAFVVGGAAYMFHWLKEASGFVRRHHDLLASRPTWLFSSGPLGTDLVDKDGNDVLEVSRPKELAELATLVGAREVRIFFGAWDPEYPAIGLAERILRMTPASKTAFPTGDFRDWPAIDAWAREIAAQVGPVPVG